MGNSGGDMEQAELQRGHVRPFKRRAPLQLRERLSFFPNGRNGGGRKEQKPFILSGGTDIEMRQQRR